MTEAERPITIKTILNCKFSCHFLLSATMNSLKSYQVVISLKRMALALQAAKWSLRKIALNYKSTTSFLLHTTIRFLLILSIIMGFWYNFTTSAEFNAHETDHLYHR